MIRTLGLLLLLNSDALVQGLELYQQGEFSAATESFLQAQSVLGMEHAPELHYNLALCAVQSDQWPKVPAYLDAMGESGEPLFANLQSFLRGNLAFAECQQAEFLASKPDAVPADYDKAIALALAAKNHWQLALLSRSHWPEACRNVERALLKLEQLKLQKEATKNNARKKLPKTQNKSGDKPQPLPQGLAQPQSPELAPVQLTDQQINELLESLAQKEQDKKKTRQSGARSPAQVERDW